MLTYKEAFDKITEAYIKGEIRPMDIGFCFCGTLAGNTEWHLVGTRDFSALEFGRMEDALFAPILKEGRLGIVEKRCHSNPCGRSYMGSLKTSHPEYEEVLFEGMCNALDEMRKIYIERGLPVEETPTFIKRESKKEETHA